MIKVVKAGPKQFKIEGDLEKAAKIDEIFTEIKNFLIPEDEQKKFLESLESPYKTIDEFIEAYNLNPEGVELTEDLKEFKKALFLDEQ